MGIAYTIYKLYNLKLSAEYFETYLWPVIPPHALKSSSSVILKIIDRGTEHNVMYL